MKLKSLIICVTLPLMFSTVYAEEKITLQNDVVGCENKSGLGDATSAILNGGFTAFLPYVKSHGCLYIRKGGQITKLKTKMPYIQVHYHNDFGKDRNLWLSYDAI
ncbi:MAG TPA: hypothetical protein ENK94_01920 [Campylobacterales bacterium]|nr:hypothetical protein [Campylobacterales bacterium]